MKSKVIIALILYLTSVTFLSANPYLLHLINELIVSPDSMERIEFRKDIYFWPQDTVPWYKYIDFININGVQYRVDSLIPGTDSFHVFITPECTTPPFTLPDSGALIEVIDSSQGLISDFQYSSTQDNLPAPPPPGYSLCIYYFYSHDFYTYDSTPTIGSENDTLGGVWGRVYSAEDSSFLWNGVNIIFIGNGIQDTVHPTSGVSEPYFSYAAFLPPGQYYVRVEHPDYLHLEDSIFIVSGEIPVEKNFYLYAQGVREEMEPDQHLLLKRSHNGFLVDISSPGYTFLSINLYDISGRKRRTLYSGYVKNFTKTFAPNRLARGIYFVIIQYGETRKTFPLLVTR